VAKPGIDELLLDGWTPRIKKVKGKRYITAWKGKKERGFGPYSDELWDKVKPVDPWVTPAQVLELEKRMNKKIERSKRKENIAFNTDIVKMIKQLKESNREENKSFDALRLDFDKMRGELTKSARRRLRGVDACRHMDKDGVCYGWSSSRNSNMTTAYHGPMKRVTKNGKIVYRIRVIDNPLICIACPSYERKRQPRQTPVNKARTLTS